MAIRPLFNKPRRSAVVAGLTTALLGCAVEPGPPGGERPELAAVPARAEPRYDAFERTLLRDALVAAAAETASAREVARARREGEAPITQAALPAPPAVPASRRELPPPPPAFSVEDNLVSAEGLVALAAAVGRDRLELARRAAIRADLEGPDEPTLARVTALVFPPGGAALSDRERARLARALARTGVDGPWIVRTSGAHAEARAQAVQAALVELGVAAENVVLARRERDVDVAEIAVRR